MESKILKVVRQGEAFSVQSAKAETGTIQKCNIVLRECDSLLMNIKDKRSKRFWHQKYSLSPDPSPKREGRKGWFNNIINNVK